MNDFFLTICSSRKEIFYCTGISKIILAKGGHGLENVRLNLFRVTISSVAAPFL
jgi:hypothetical protein